MDASSVTWTLEGVDAGDFTINAMTGVVSMVARNFEMPEDGDTMNDYEVTVKATDADQNMETVAITVTVTNVNEAATLTISGYDVNAMIAENAAYVSMTPMVTTSLPMDASAVTWTLEGDDAGDFTINAMTGVVSMVERNFEAPEDGDTMNDYEVTVKATDADQNMETVAITVTVTNVNELATLTISGYDLLNAMIAENAAYDSMTPMVTTSLPMDASAVTWTLEGVDAGDFTINAMTGVVSMVERNFEMPDDADMLNDYEVTVRATDADQNTQMVAITVTVTNVNEPATLTITGFTDATVAENAAYVSMTPMVDENAAYVSADSRW